MIHYQVLIQHSHMRMTIFFTTHFVCVLHILYIWDKQNQEEVEVSLYFQLKSNHFKVFINQWICLHNNIAKPHLLSKNLEIPSYQCSVVVSKHSCFSKQNLRCTMGKQILAYLDWTWLVDSLVSGVSTAKDYSHHIQLSFPLRLILLCCR